MIVNKLIDKFGRAHTYLRISVTDRCNLRCVYCMPPEGINVRKKDEILSFEEIFRIARIFVEMGITKIRLTGGEPLVRKDLYSLFAMLQPLDGLQTLALTTNGVLLPGQVEKLKQSGLRCINISLDTLRQDRFLELTLRDQWQPVMDGILAAEQAEFESLKLNVVMIKNRNGDELLDFVEFVKDRKINIRFIEYMPFKDNNWDLSGVFSFAEMRSTIEQRYKLRPIMAKAGDVAKDFYIEGHTGTVSFISSMTDSFCASCNRLRLTADGSIKSCLFYEPEISFRDKLRSGCSDQDLRNMILYALEMKPEAHPPMEELAKMSNRAMVEIGG